MLLASLDGGFSTAFGIFLVLHILAVVVAFAPGFVTPTLLKGPAKTAVAETLSKTTQRIYGPALVLAGLFGFAMIGMSNKAFMFKQAWVSAAAALWIIMIGVVFGLLQPAERKVAAGEADAEKKVAMFGGIIHLLFLVVVILMIFKPGFPST